MTVEEYEYIKEIGQAVGYITNELEKATELKEQIINISKNYAYTHDLLRLKNQLNELEIDQSVKDLLFLNIEKIDDFKGEKLAIYSNNVYIPNDEEFIENNKNLLGTKPLMELYNVPFNVITAKIYEINRYGQKDQKSI